MRRCAAHFSEVIRCIDDAVAEMIVPHTIDDAAPRQWVFRIGNPFSERSATCPFVLLVIDGEL